MYYYATYPDSVPQMDLFLEELLVAASYCRFLVQDLNPLHHVHICETSWPSWNRIEHEPPSFLHFAL